jgi:hypothetical protein
MINFGNAANSQGGLAGDGHGERADALSCPVWEVLACYSAPTKDERR